MTNQSTIDTLKQMRFSAMAKELESQLSDPDTYSSLGFEERIALLVDAEWNRRQAAFCGARRTPMRFRADAVRSITDALNRLL